MLKKSFKIENSIYPEDIMQAVVQLFGENFSIQYHSQELEISCETEQEIQEVFWECMNYAIGMINEAS